MIVGEIENTAIHASAIGVIEEDLDWTTEIR
jgi:hypothetical protein